MTMSHIVHVRNKISRLNGLFPRLHGSFCVSATRTNRHRDTQNTYTPPPHTHTHRHNDRLVKVWMTFWERFTGHEFFFINTRANTHTHTHTHTQSHTRTHAITQPSHTNVQTQHSELHYGECNTSRVVISPPPLPHARTYADKLKHTHTHTRTNRHNVLWCVTYALSFP